MIAGNFTAPGLVLLTGLPGAGKTTVAARLAGLVEADHFESDAVRFALAGRPTYTSAESAKVFAEIERRAAASLEGGRVAIVDATNLTRRDRRRFVRLAARRGVTLVVVRIVAPDDVIRRRLDGPRAGASEATVAIYEQMRPRVQPVAGPAVVIDTRFPMEPSLALIVRMLGSTDS